MSEKTRDELKTYFQSGKRPTGQQFADLIDSVINKLDDGIGVDGNNMGIGTATPNAMLHIFNDQSNGLLIENHDWPELDMIAAGNTNDYRSRLTLDPVFGSLQFRLGQSTAGIDGAGDTKFLIDQNGKIGIGINDPNELLHINGAMGIGKFSNSNSEGLRLEYTDGGSGATTIKHNRHGGNFYFKRNSPSGERTQFFLGGSSHHRMYIYDDNDEVKVRLDSGGNSYLNGGNLGIGTTSPDKPLVVRSQAGHTEMRILVPDESSRSAIYFGDNEHGSRGQLSYDHSDDSFRIATNAAESIRIDTDGNVGIGVVDPQQKLDVDGRINLLDGITVTGKNNTYPMLSILNYKDISSGHPALSMMNLGGSPLTPSATNNNTLLGTIIYSGHDGTQTVQIGRISVYTDGDWSPSNYPAKMRFQIGGEAPCCGVTRMTIDGSTGNVGIGTTNPTERLHVVGDAIKTIGGSDWMVSSDKRLKKDIKPFTDSLDLLKKVQPVTYRYNGKGGIQESGEEVGVIAQEIREVFPYMVSAYKARLNESDTEDSDILSFNGSALKFVMLNAIKELDETNKKLNKTNKKQKEINKKLEKRLARLELQSGL